VHGDDGLARTGAAPDEDGAVPGPLDKLALRRVEGSGANYLAGASAPCCCARTSGLKHRVPDCRRNSALAAQTSQCELSLADALHQLDAGDGDGRIPEPLET
jgi:hypothetical protein